MTQARCAFEYTIDAAIISQPQTAVHSMDFQGVVPLQGIPADRDKRANAMLPAITAIVITRLVWSLLTDSSSGFYPHLGYMYAQRVWRGMRAIKNWRLQRKSLCISSHRYLHFAVRRNLIARAIIKLTLRSSFLARAIRSRRSVSSIFA